MHTTKSGKKIDISKMSDKHLLNTISFIKRKAKDGVVVMCGGGGSYAEDMYCDESILFEEEALQELGFYKYENEAIKRKLSK